MPRYIKQRDKYSCGPIAVLNAMKWAGDPQATLDRMGNNLYWLCHCIRPLGTSFSRFDAALRFIGETQAYFSVRKVRRPTLAEIETHLHTGGSLVLNYYWRLDPGYRPEETIRECRHYAFVDRVREDGSQFRIVNAARKSTACWIDREEFKGWELRFQRADKGFTAWFLTRELMEQ